MPDYIEYEFKYSLDHIKARQLTKDLKKCLKENVIRYERVMISSYNMFLIEVKDQVTAIRIMNAILPYRTVSMTCKKDSFTLSTMEMGATSFKIRL